jgi:hypothetical protein
MNDIPFTDEMKDRAVRYEICRRAQDQARIDQSVWPDERYWHYEMKQAEMVSSVRVAYEQIASLAFRHIGKNLDLIPDHLRDEEHIKIYINMRKLTFQVRPHDGR